MAILNTLIVNGSSRYLQKAYFQDLQVSGTASLASLSLSGNLSVGGNATVSGTLGVTGEATFSNVAVFSKVGQSTATWNSPALVVGGTPDQRHLELCNDTIQGKNNKNTTNNLYLNYYGSNVYLAGSKIYAIRDSTFVTPTADIVTVNAQNVNVSNNLRANHYDLQSVAQLGGSFYVSPTVKFPNSSTSLTVAKSDATLTLTITDSSITSTTMAGIVWTANSRVKVSGTINGVVTGTMDGTITSINTSSHVLTLSVSGENSGNVVAGTYSASQFSDLSVMVYQRKDGSNDYRVGIWMNCYDVSNSSSTIRIYGGTTALPNVMIGNLTNAGLGTVNNLTPTGWGLFAQNAFLHGSIVAKDGRIGGFTLSENWMYSSSNAPAANNLFIMPAGTSSQYTVGGQASTGWVFTSGTTFGVTKAGGVYATSGQIGGFSIGTTKLSNGTLGSDSSLFMGTTNLGSAKIADNTTDAWRFTVGSHFGVTNTGAMYSTSGKIAGWTISADGIYMGDTGMSSNTSKYAFWAGETNTKYGASDTDAKFKVTHAGVLTATGANISGKIIADDGEIGGWTISADSLYMGDTGMSSNTSKYAFWAGETNSKNGASGSNAAFRVGHDGGLIASNANISGTISATGGSIGSFTIDSNSIHNGTFGNSGSVMMCTGSNGSKNIGGSGSISGWCFTAGDKFGVTTSGALYSTSGKIGGFTIGASSISSITSNVSFTISSTTNYSAVLIKQDSSNYTRVGLSEIEVVGGTGTAISGGTISTHEIQATGEIETTALGSGGTVKLYSGYNNGLSVQNRLTNGTNQEVLFILNNNSNAGIYDATNQSWGIVYNYNNDLCQLRAKTCGVHIGVGNTSGTKTFMPRAADGGKSDGVVYCGASDCRWNTVYSKNGTKTSSDERLKKIYRHLDEDHKKLFMELQPIEYSFIDKPDEKHFGLGAQTTEVAMRKYGFGSEYSLVEHAFYDEEDSYGRNDTYNMNYDEAAMLAIPVVQEHEAEIQKLKAKINELETKLSQLTQ